LDLTEMGTTMVAARFSPNQRRVYVGHVGDSRCYRFRDSKLTQITTDHTMRHFGLEGPHANDLFRALGVEQNVTIDLVVDSPRPEDIYLLCSDGLPKMVSDDKIEDSLRQESDLEAAVYRLIEQANDAGGRDNVTVLLVRVREPLPLEAGLSADVVGKAPATEHAQSKRKPIKNPASTPDAERGPSR
jgi:protein phosphatase